MVDYGLKAFGKTTVAQIVNEGIGEIAMKSIAMRRPQIFGIDTYTLGNLVGGAVIGIGANMVKELKGEMKVAVEIVGAGMFAKGLVKLVTQLTAPSAGMYGYPSGIRVPVAVSVGPSGMPMGMAAAAGASIF